ncbi:MAG: hypothetical protein H6729_06375 [Deltaproteobacteria bacterium]|nr:hypothetical protein [Deltaproteobacteria bacterium]
MSKKTDKKTDKKNGAKAKAKAKQGEATPKSAAPSATKVFTFAVTDEREAQVLIRARTKREAEDFLADHQNEIDWESLRWAPQGLEFRRSHDEPFDPETFGGVIHLDASAQSE